MLVISPVYLFAPLEVYGGGFACSYPAGFLHPSPHPFFLFFLFLQVVKMSVKIYCGGQHMVVQQFIHH